MFSDFSFGVGDAVIIAIVWWVIFFTVLPIGIKRDDNSKLGWDTGAPQKFNLPRKMIITSCLAIIAWLIIYTLIHSQWFPALLGVT